MEITDRIRQRTGSSDRGYQVAYQEVGEARWVTTRPVFPSAPAADEFADTLARLPHINAARVRPL